MAEAEEFAAVDFEELVAAAQDAVAADGPVGQDRANVVVRPHLAALLDVDGALQADAQTARRLELAQLRHHDVHLAAVHQPAPLGYTHRNNNDINNDINIMVITRFEAIP